MFSKGGVKINNNLKKSLYLLFRKKQAFLATKKISDIFLTIITNNN